MDGWKLSVILMYSAVNGALSFENTPTLYGSSNYYLSIDVP